MYLNRKYMYVPEYYGLKPLQGMYTVDVSVPLLLICCFIQKMVSVVLTTRVILERILHLP